MPLEFPMRVTATSIVFIRNYCNYSWAMPQEEHSSRRAAQQSGSRLYYAPAAPVLSLHDPTGIEPGGAGLKFS
jgi:hypothetical protein